MIIFSWHFQNIRLTVCCIFPSITGLIGYKVSFIHGMMYRSHVVTTWYTWKMCIRMFNILSFSETVYYMSKTLLMLRCLKMFKMFAGVLELDRATAVTVPVNSCDCTCN